jgi:hypothetical protein
LEHEEFWLLISPNGPAINRPAFWATDAQMRFSGISARGGSLYAKVIITRGRFTLQSSDPHTSL